LTVLRRQRAIWPDGNFFLIHCGFRLEDRTNFVILWPCTAEQRQTGIAMQHEAKGV
jgi:hypothetical protein